MKLIIEASETDYKRIESGDLSVLYGRLPEIEVHQEGGLLSFTRRLVSIVECRSTYPIDGLPDGPGVPVVVHLPYQPNQEG